MDSLFYYLSFYCNSCIQQIETNILVRVLVVEKSVCKMIIETLPKPTKNVTKIFKKICISDKAKNSSIKIRKSGKKLSKKSRNSFSLFSNLLGR